MKALTYHAQPPFVRLADKAARAWNRALGVEVFHPEGVASILIGFGPVDRTTQADRVAQHERIGTLHRITLAPDIRWRVTRWERFWGLGKEDALAALLHEFGHCLGLPHSHNFTHVMHHELGSTVISSEEAASYRKFLNL
jgi:HD superfamily phosphohydrolase